MSNKFVFLLSVKRMETQLKMIPQNQSNRSSRPEVFLVKVVLKICSKFTGEHPCCSAISIKLLCDFRKKEGRENN